MTRPAEVLRFIARSSKRIAVSVVGGAFVLGGIAMLVLPGPAARAASRIRLRRNT